MARGRGDTIFRASERSSACILVLLSLACSTSGTRPSNSIAQASDPGDALIADIPFRGLEGNRIFIDIAPDGNRPLELMLDTGANTTILTPLIARRAGISVRKNKSGSYRRATRLGKTLRFYVDSSLSDTGSQTGWEYGLLGGDFLVDFVFELDFVNQRVRFYDRKKYRVPEETTTPGDVIVALDMRYNRPFVEIEMNGQRTWVLLDTGAPPTLSLSGPAARGLRVDPDALEDIGEGQGTRGSFPLQVFESKSLIWGGFELGPLPVFVAPHGHYNQAGVTDSVLGYEIMKNFTIQLDYRSRRMLLRRERHQEIGSRYLPAAPPPAADQFPTLFSEASGVEVMQSNIAITVLRVEHRSSGAKLGVKVGDSIEYEAFEERPSLSEVLDRIGSQTPLRVLRQGGHKGAGRIVLLPNKRAYKARLATLEQDHTEMVARRDRQRLDRFEAERDQRLFARTPGGWVVVDERQKRRGPKRSETWVSYEEMKRLKEEEAENASQ